MINRDMADRFNREKALAVHGTGTSPMWNQIVNKANVDFEIAFHESDVGPSDHASFY